jgi:hypothetical protein
MVTVSTTTIVTSYSDGTSREEMFAGDGGHAYATEQRFWMGRDALHPEREHRIVAVEVR